MHRKRYPSVGFAICVPVMNAESNGAARDTVARRLENTRARVRALNVRAAIRAGELRIRNAEGVLEDLKESEERSEKVALLIAELERELRTLKKIHPDEYDEERVEFTADSLKAVMGKAAHLIVPASLEGEGVYDGDSSMEGNAPGEVVDWTVGKDTRIEGEMEEESGDEAGDVHGSVQIDSNQQNFIFVQVRQKVAQQGAALRRKASDVGAGLSDTLTEFVKEDGSIDFHVLRSIVQNAFDKAGGTWQRLNGRVPGDSEKGSWAVGGNNMSEGSTSPYLTRDEEKQFQLRETIGELEKQLIEASKARENVLRREDQLGKLIRAKEIRAMDDNVSAVRRTLAVRVLQLEMEKIFESLAGEVESSSYELMRDQRLMIAEFGELDERLAEMEVFVDNGEPVLIEDDNLGAVASDIQYLKTRLGLDAQLYSSATLDWTQVRQIFAASGRKFRAGIEFYARGMRLFYGDLKFSFRLVRRAILGYTPTPREVRTLRRTGRDFLTLIPFTIILILPLSPVGHVLVFSFLQRYWPDFFPSTFSERRQSLMRRYEEYARDIDEDTEDSVDDSGSRAGISGDEGQAKRLMRGGFKRIPFFGAWLSGSGENATEDTPERVSGSASKTATATGLSDYDRLVGSVTERAAVSSEKTRSNSPYLDLRMDEVVRRGTDADSTPYKKGVTASTENANGTDKNASNGHSGFGKDEVHLAD